MPLIKLERVCKSFQDPQKGKHLSVLDHISLDIEQNEFICLLGPSGCGKSTVLNLIAGFEQPNSGKILMANQAINSPSPERGVVFQQPTLMPWLTVWENIAFHLRIKGKRTTVRKTQAQHYIDAVGLTGFEHHYPHQLSGGMQQRVGIARALLLNPAVILMDEPFAALDAQTRNDMQVELVRIWQQYHSTIIFVTHSIEEALVLGTKVIMMSQRPGRIIESLSINLPRPRDTTSTRFNDYKRELLNLIKLSKTLQLSATT